MKLLYSMVMNQVPVKGRELFVIQWFPNALNRESVYSTAGKVFEETEIVL